jgi:hypothetical protein
MSWQAGITCHLMTGDSITDDLIQFDYICDWAKVQRILSLSKDICSCSFGEQRHTAAHRGILGGPMTEARLPLHTFSSVPISKLWWIHNVYKSAFTTVNGFFFLFVGSNRASQNLIKIIELRMVLENDCHRNDRVHSALNFRLKLTSNYRSCRP